MKIKTLGRVSGAVTASAFTVCGYFLYKTLPNIDYNQLINIISSDNPLEYKLLSGLASGLAIGASALSLALTPLIALGIVDGLTDVVKGTHHYFGCRVWQKLTRNPETKKRIQSELEEQLIKIQKDI